MEALRFPPYEVNAVLKTLDFCVQFPDLSQAQEAWLVLCKAGLDEMEEPCATDRTVRGHADFYFSLGRAGAIVGG